MNNAINSRKTYVYETELCAVCVGAFDTIEVRWGNPPAGAPMYASAVSFIRVVGGERLSFSDGGARELQIAEYEIRNAIYETKMNVRPTTDDEFAIFLESHVSRMFNVYPGPSTEVDD